MLDREIAESICLAVKKLQKQDKHVLFVRFCKPICVRLGANLKSERVDIWECCPGPWTWTIALTEDYFSCPQLSEADLKKSVDSIPGYVARSEYLFILCPVACHLVGGLDYWIINTEFLALCMTEWQLERELYDYADYILYYYHILSSWILILWIMFG